MLKFGDTYIKFNNGYIADYTSNFGWSDLVTPESGLLPLSGWSSYTGAGNSVYWEKTDFRGIGVSSYDDNTISSLPCMQNAKSVGTNSVSPWFSGNISIPLTEEMKNYNNYLYINYDYEVSRPAYYTTAVSNNQINWDCKISLDNKVITDISSINIGASLKTDGHYEQTYNDFYFPQNQTPIRMNHIINGKLWVNRVSHLVDMRTGSCSSLLRYTNDNTMATPIISQTYFSGYTGNNLLFNLYLSGPASYVPTGDSWRDWRQAASKIGNFSMSATNKNLITLKEFNEL